MLTLLYLSPYIEFVGETPKGLSLGGKFCYCGVGCFSFLWYNHETFYYPSTCEKQWTGMPGHEKATQCATLLTSGFAPPGLLTSLAPVLHGHADHSCTWFLCLECSFQFSAQISTYRWHFPWLPYMKAQPLISLSLSLMLYRHWPLFSLSPCILEGVDFAFFVYCSVWNNQNSVYNMVET